jgi:hypothetical protein
VGDDAADSAGSDDEDLVHVCATRGGKITGAWQELTLGFENRCSGFALPEVFPDNFSIARRFHP